VEQAHVILELGNPAAAAQLSQAVWDEAEDHVSHGMRCWLAAAAGELHAAAGDRLAARTMLCKAEADADCTGGNLPPYVVFNEAHLDRWIGHSLVLMGDSAAEEPLRRAAEEMDPTFARARAALEVDLACALRGVENDEAEEHLQRAEALATKVRSRRQLDRVHRLRLVGR
jgi:hypothetical protein